MRAFMTALIVALGMALPASAAPGDDVLKIEFKDSRMVGKTQHVRLEITTTLPAATILNVDLARVRETFGQYHLVPSISGTGGGLLRVSKKKFPYDTTLGMFGHYEAEVTFMKELQRTEYVLPKDLKELKDPRWKCSFDAWDENLIQVLCDELKALDEVLAVAKDFMRRIDDATVTEELWTEQKAQLSSELDQLLAQIGRVSRRCYPAAIAEMMASARVICGGQYCFKWKDGRFIGAMVYKGTTPLKTHRGEAFTFKNYARYLTEADEIAGREFGLWILKEVRRSQVPPTDAIIEAIKVNEGHRGIAPFSLRLQACAADDIDKLEKEIRTMTPPAIETPPAPGAEKKEGDGNVPPPGGEAPGDKKDEKTDQEPGGKPEETKVESKEPVKEPAK